MTGTLIELPVCCRCGDAVEKENLIRLNTEEVNFIRSKFNGPLCPACLNQLKTSYKILKDRPGYRLTILNS